MNSAGIPHDIVMKVQRAEHHLIDLERQTEDFVANSIIMKPRQFDTEKGAYVYRVHILNPPDELGLVASDFIHNLRSALDHLAWKLAIKNLANTGKNPNPKLAFPVYKEKPKETDLDRNIGDLSFKAQEVIKQIQPYQRGETWMHDPLWLLHDIWNCDKHRTIIVATNMIAGSYVGGIAYSHLEGDVDWVWEVPQQETTDNKNEPKVSVQIIFEWGTYEKSIGKWIRTTSLPQFREIYEYVTMDVLPRFSGLLT